MIKNIVFYHHPCTDGITAAWCFSKRLLSEETQYIGLGYPAKFDKTIVLGKNVYVLDYSFDVDLMIEIINMSKKTVWLDHHISAINKWKTSDSKYWQEFKSVDFLIHQSNKFEMCLRNDVSGAMLSWLYTNGEDIFKSEVARHMAPDFIRHIEDRDLWKKTIPYTDEFTFNLRTLPITIDSIEIISKFNKYEYNKFIEDGKSIKRYFEQQLSELVKYHQKIVLDGEVGLACNGSFGFSSDLGNLLAEKSKTYGASWFVDQNMNAVVSLRSIGNYDVSKLANKYGGGGHKNAAAFKMLNSKFIKNLKGI